MSIPCLVNRDLNRYLAEQEAQDAYEEALGTRAYQIEKEILGYDTELARLFNEDLASHLSSAQAALVIRELFKGNAKPMAEVFQRAMDSVVLAAAQDELGVH